MLNLSSWPKVMRVIVRKERLHPGAQLRFTDIDGHRFTFATSTRSGQLADLELRYKRRARCEDRIRCAEDTGLRNLPLHGYDQNKVWCEITAMACETAGLGPDARPHLSRPAVGTPDGCGCGSSPPPAASSAADAGSASPADGHGQPDHRQRRPDTGPRT